MLERLKRIWMKKKDRPLKHGLQEKKESIDKKRALAKKIMNGYFIDKPHHAT